MIGQTVANYQILEQLGQGGMGVVYKAHDTKLDRDVALKFLPAHLSGSATDKARFIQEAKAASALNHPNVCTIHDIQEHDGTMFIVMEFVDGQTLRQKEGTLGLARAIEIGIQISDGLAVAHEKGIVHRDIKPENIMVRKDGIVQIMDFGLAKLRASRASRLTKEGSTVGTAGYMSPEQVQGQETDHRSDIFSLGVLLYELFSGELPFKGVHETALLYEIVNVDPAPMSAVKPEIDPELDRIVLECLQKEPDERYQAVKDVSKDLKRFKRESSRQRASRTIPTRQFQPPAAHEPAARRAMPSLWQASTLVLAIAAGLLAWAPWRQAETPKIPLMRFPITLPLRSALIGGAATLSIAPDGRNIVYLGEVAGNQQLFLRPIDQFIAQPLAGTDGAFDPFFSPDGKWVAFFTANKLKKISVHGGAPIDVCTTEGFPRGGWWSSDDFIWYGSINQTVFRLPASGGTPVAVTQLDSANHEISHRFPQVLSDNKTIIYTVKQNNITSFDEANIAVENIDTHHRTILVHGGSYARYIPTGHVLYARGTLINAVPFDLKHPDVAGTPIAAIEGGLLNPLSGYANYCVSNNGILAYVPFGPIGEDDARICWVHRDGTVHALIDTLRPYGYASLSPDGLRLAMTIRAANDDIWIFHLARGTMTRLTFGGGNSDFPSWTPDGKRILYITERGRTWRYFTKLSDGSGAEEELNSSINPDPIAPPSFSPDGRLLVYAKEGNIWTMTLDGDHRASLLLESPANKQAPRFSPDGKWLSYTSNESGRNEVFVVPFPKAEGKWQVSTNGGDGARWTKNGRELLYVEGRTLMTVEVTTTPSFDFSLPKKLFELPSNWNGPFFDPQPDGERVIVSLNAPHPQEATQINVVVGWFDELKQKFARNEQQ